MINTRELFEKHKDEYCKGLTPKMAKRFPTKREDLWAFLLLDSLIPSNRTIVACARHEKIYLDADTEDLDPVATEEDILALTRCGVFLEEDSLVMFG